MPIMPSNKIPNARNDLNIRISEITDTDLAINKYIFKTIDTTVA